MNVSVEVVNDTTHEVTLDASDTYADCLRAVGLSVHEATVLVDGRPVPDDAPVEADHVQVLRLVQGG